MKVIGIDLGTTNSCVYYLNDDGNPVLVLDEKERGIFPSAVWSAGPGKDIVVGHRAKARMGSHPTPVIAVKRKMGTQDTVTLGGKKATPVEVSTEILRYARRLVEEATNDKVGAVVVTVPAYFDTAPKSDTRLAAVQAFFDGNEAAAEGRLELQLEPEAAAYAYTMEDTAPSLTVLVFDLGGGTFDVTVLEKTPESGLAVLKFGGDPHLGGDNVNDRIAIWVLYLLRSGKPEVLQRVLAPGRYPAEKRYTVLQQLFAGDAAGLSGTLRPEDRDLLIPAKPKYNLDLDPSDPQDLARIQRLKLLAEDAKKDLTVSTEAAIVKQTAFTDHDDDLVDINVTLSRKDFNLLIGDMVEKTIHETLKVVAASGVKADRFDKVLLVGGSSRMPVIREELTKIFGCEVLLADPDLIVARGAAIRARSLNPDAALSGSNKLSLEYPRQTASTKVMIKGQLSDHLSGHQVYLTRDGKDILDQALKGDSFLLDVEIEPDCENSFRIEVVHSDTEAVYAGADVRIRHTNQAGPSDHLASKITKPIRCLGLKGFKIIFDEGVILPAQRIERCFWSGRGESIVIPFFEGERFLRDLRITGIDTRLSEGTPVRLQITIQKDFAIAASAEVETSGQKADVEFQIERIKIPTTEEMNADFEETVAETRDAIAALQDRNKRAPFNRALRALEAEFKKAGKAADPDRHHLFTLIGELKKLKTEIGNSQTFLQPDMDEFERVLVLCRGLVSKLLSSSVLNKNDVSEKLTFLERAGKDAYEANDAPNWKNVNQQLKKEHKGLEEATRPPAPPPSAIPPQALLRYLTDTLREIHEKIQANGLEEQFDAEWRSVETAAHRIDMSDEDRARDEIKQLYRERVAPLSSKVDKAVQPTGDEDESLVKTNVYF